MLKVAKESILSASDAEIKEIKLGDSPPRFEWYDLDDELRPRFWVPIALLDFKNREVSARCESLILRMTRFSPEKDWEGVVVSKDDGPLSDALKKDCKTEKIERASSPMKKGK